MPKVDLDGWYGGDLIPAPRHQRSPAEQLALLDWHPIFTGRCPKCEVPILQRVPGRKHWECGACGCLKVLLGRGNTPDGRYR